MPDKRAARIPKYRLHKPSGLAVVRLNGRDVYLGQHGTEESRQRYEQVIAEWLSNHRLVAERRELLDSPRALSVNELVVAYLEHAESYYVKNGQPTGEFENIKDAVRQLFRLYGKTLVADFGPPELKAVRNAMIKAKLCRNVINARVKRIRRIFKWGVGNQFVSTGVLLALQSLEPLKRDRSQARESAPVGPVPEDHVNKVLELLPRQVRAMAELQLLTGMRPGEATAMRTGDLDMSARIWVYKPGSHKT